MASPVLLPTRITEGQGPGLQYRIEGELLPALHLALAPNASVFFEHHAIMWKNPDVDLQLMKLREGFKRMIAGMPILMTYATGPGEMAFSRDTPGHVFPINLNHGGTILVREHQFLAATANLEYSFERVKGARNMFMGQAGFFVDRFTASNGDAVVWLHAYGNAYEVSLAPGEAIDVEPGSWVYREDSVRYEQKVVGFKTGFLGGGGSLFFNRFTGPGRVGLQSGYFSDAMPEQAGGARPQQQQQQGGIGGMLGGILGGG
jgi:uncharacterized protein (AIM24 family)